VSVPIDPHLVFIFFPDSVREVLQKMESARIGGGRVIDLPIEEYIGEDGNLLYVVLFADGNEIGYVMDESMPLQEARAHIHELVLMDIRNGRYDPLDMRVRMGYQRVPDADENEEASYTQHHHGFSVVPASAWPSRTCRRRPPWARGCARCVWMLSMRMVPSLE
jgi:hypothetical protein